MQSRISLVLNSLKLSHAFKVPTILVITRSLPIEAFIGLTLKGLLRESPGNGRKAVFSTFPPSYSQSLSAGGFINQMGKWLNGGHAVRAAEWMKVIYWKRAEAGVSPFEAVRKCLDHVEH